VNRRRKKQNAPIRSGRTCLRKQVYHRLKVCQGKLSLFRKIFLVPYFQSLPCCLIFKTRAAALAAAVVAEPSFAEKVPKALSAQQATPPREPPQLKSARRKPFPQRFYAACNSRSILPAPERDRPARQPQSTRRERHLLSSSGAAIIVRYRAILVLCIASYNYMYLHIYVQYVTLGKGGLCLLQPMRC
jgi:hypothetical protein